VSTVKVVLNTGEFRRHQPTMRQARTEAAASDVMAYAREQRRLLVVIGDRLSLLIKKGVVIERYYNPGNLFREVHILMTNDDRPDPAAVQPMVGDAILHLHNVPGGRELFLRSLGFRPILLKGVVSRAVSLVAAIKPQLIRCHGAYLNAYLAQTIHRAQMIPYVVSLHICPEDHFNIFVSNSVARLGLHGFHLGRGALQEAQAVLPVYQSIGRYLQRHGIQNFEVAYNVINPSSVRSKNSYALGSPIRVICIGRQIAEKNPRNIIKAIAALPNVHLTLVGDGPMHTDLRKLAADSGHPERFTFIRSIPNDTLCRMLPDFDLLTYHSDYAELSKVIIEGALTGLPMIVNRRKKDPVPELERGVCELVDDSERDYRAALVRLCEDHTGRERLGRDARAHALAHWHPATTELNYVRIYRNILSAKT
jgi:glycosyltransferase involved in cell wall biosynthesis